MKEELIDPKAIIRKLSVEQLSQTADDYFKAVVDPSPLMAKPFSGLVDAPILLQNMGQLLSGLRLGKTMKVLDFAAGTCWFSRYLQQLQCDVICCDVSTTALDIGKRLFDEHPNIGSVGAAPVFLPFDGHKIDLPDESVDRILCHDGFHHIPNQEEVIAEFARVLKPGGIAGFSEPGRYHSQSAQSQYEMKNYNVLENDVIIEDIDVLAKKYGFTDIRLKVLSDIEISLNQYNLLRRKPILSILRHISPQLADNLTSKTIFFLFKGAYVPDSRSHAYLSHAMTVTKKDYSASVNEDISIDVEVHNNGISRWLCANRDDLGAVKFGTHLYDMDDNLLNINLSRHELKNDIDPGTKFKETIKLSFDAPGDYKVAIDMVSEHVCWFENMGSMPVFINVKVT